MCVVCAYLERMKAILQKYNDICCNTGFYNRNLAKIHEKIAYIYFVYNMIIM